MQDSYIKACTLCPTNPRKDASGKSFPGFLIFFCGLLRNNGYRFQCNLTELTEEKEAHAETFWVQGSSVVPFECTQGSTKHS